jgi:hypothetical protein
MEATHLPNGLNEDSEYVGSVSLILIGEDLDPDIVSSALELAPSQCWRRGEKSLRLADGTTQVRESEYEWGGWKLFVAVEHKDGPIESQLQYWVELLQPRIATLKRLRLLGHECALDVFVTSNETASFALCSRLLKSVAALEVEMRLSFWASSERRSRAA